MKEHESVEKYLEEVGSYLKPIADRDQIIKELRAHIWDVANQISERKPGLSIQAAFAQAVLNMEDPQTLASKFLEEESDDLGTWKTPITVPEKKIQNEQFLIIAIIGFASVLVMSWIIQMVSQNTLVTIVSVFIGLLAAGLFTLGLYLSDERLFHEQVARFREFLQKPRIDQKVTKPSTKEKTVFVQAETGYREVGFWSAFGEHLGGVLGGIFIGFVIAVVFILDVTNALPLFNENWDIIGRLAVYCALGTSLAYSASLVIFGRIRITRLFSAVKNVIGLICAVILVLYYPFTLELAILAQNIPEVMSDPDLLTLVGNSDLILQVVIGVSGVISGISALYDTFKFGAWKPSDRKSLI
ncbi:MAG: hypothetical protein ACFFAJ_12145 [Candidatus Hodarchaeota archaeon]